MATYLNLSASSLQAYNAHRAAIAASLGVPFSPVFENSYGGVTYLGSSIEANETWNYVNGRSSILEPDPAAGTNSIMCNAEPGLLPSPDAARLRLNQGNNDFIYCEWHVKGTPDSDPWGPASNRTFVVGFSGDSNGIDGASFTNSKSLAIQMNGVFRIYTRKYLYGIQQEENDNTAVNDEVLSNPQKGLWLGVLVETDGTGRVWTHINGIWTTTGANGGDPDAGGPGYTPSSSTGTYWLCPYIQAVDDEQFVRSDLRVTITGKPKYVPAAATLVLNS